MKKSSNSKEPLQENTGYINAIFSAIYSTYDVLKKIFNIFGTPEEDLSSSNNNNINSVQADPQIITIKATPPRKVAQRKIKTAHLKNVR